MKEKEKNLLSMKPKVSLDAVLKDFFQRKERIADLLNAVLLGGDSSISADMIETMDSDSSSVVEVEDGCFTTGKRQRDKLLRVGFEDGTKISFGIEFQSTVDYDMILRIFFYTCDFLSRERKLDDAQLKLINLVLFTGEGKWSAKKSLKELAGMVNDDRLNELLANLSYEVHDFKEVDTSKLKNREVRDAIEGIQLVYAGMKGILKERREISKASLLVIVAATGSWDVYNEVMKTKGERVIMCEAFEKWAREIEERNLMIGERRGEMRGEIRGEIKGEIKGEKKYCIKMLKKKFGRVSEETQSRIMDSTPEQFERLSDYLFSINNENEIHSYLN